MTSFLLAKPNPLSKALHELYDRVAKEPVPDDMLKLLGKLK